MVCLFLSLLPLFCRLPLFLLTCLSLYILIGSLAFFYYEDTEQHLTVRRHRASSDMQRYASVCVLLVVVSVCVHIPLGICALWLLSPLIFTVTVWLTLSVSLPPYQRMSSLDFCPLHPSSGISQDVDPQWFNPRAEKGTMGWLQKDACQTNDRTDIQWHTQSTNHHR